MTLSDISIKNPVFAWMLMAALIVFGGIAYKDLGVSQMPEIDFPVLTVTVTWEGAAPEVMESDVADVIEDAVMSSQGLREVSSTTRQGSTEVEVAGARQVSSEAGRLPPGQDHDPEEAELRPAEDREGAADERERDHRLHPGDRA